MVETSPTSSARFRRRIALNLARSRLSKGLLRGLPSPAKRFLGRGAFGPEAISGLRTDPGLIRGTPSDGILIIDALVGGLLTGLGVTIVIPLRTVFFGSEASDFAACGAAGFGPTLATGLACFAAGLLMAFGAGACLALAFAVD